MMFARIAPAIRHDSEPSEGVTTVIHATVYTPRQKALCGARTAELTSLDNFAIETCWQSAHICPRCASIVLSVEESMTTGRIIAGKGE